MRTSPCSACVSISFITRWSLYLRMEQLHLLFLQDPPVPIFQGWCWSFNFAFAPWPLGFQGMFSQKWWGRDAKGHIYIEHDNTWHWEFGNHNHLVWHDLTFELLIVLPQEFPVCAPSNNLFEFLKVHKMADSKITETFLKLKAACKWN